jgi:hypothetical protein
VTEFEKENKKRVKMPLIRCISSYTTRPYSHLKQRIGASLLFLVVILPNFPLLICGKILIPTSVRARTQFLYTRSAQVSHFYGVLHIAIVYRWRKKNIYFWLLDKMCSRPSAAVVKIWQKVVWIVFFSLSYFNAHQRQWEQAEKKIFNSKLRVSTTRE